MSATVSLDALHHAVEWVAAGEEAMVQADAYVSVATGEVLWFGEGLDFVAPDDIGNEELYVPVPIKREFDLGQRLALAFAREHLPDSFEAVRTCFSSSGAFRRFKGLLDEIGKLADWHQYEQSEIDRQLKEWCEENGFAVSR